MRQAFQQTILSSLFLAGIFSSAASHASQVKTDILPLIGTQNPSATVTFQVVDGKALVEGDIVLGEYQDLLEVGYVNAIGHPGHATESNGRSAINPWANQWVNGVVPYAFTSGAFEQEEVNEIFKAMDDIEKAANIKFVPAKQHKNYINFVDAGEGICQSVVGMAGGAQQLSLGNGCVKIPIRIVNSKGDVVEVRYEYEKGTAIHEIMHALGFGHEQSRADRDQYVRILDWNIKPGFESQFDKLGVGSDRLGPYDYNSIMHYGSSTFGILDDTTGRKKITIEPLTSGVTIGLSDGLSALDKEALRKVYGAPIGGTGTKPETTGTKPETTGTKPETVPGNAPTNSNANDLEEKPSAGSSGALFLCGLMLAFRRRDKISVK